MFSQNKKILIVVSHPDDEILGCGGSIAKLINQKKKVYVYFTHEGSSSRHQDPKSNDALKDINNRKKMALKASKLLGYKIINFDNNTNLRNENYSLLNNIKKLTKVINKIKPGIIVTHHHDDMNEDHFLTYKTVVNSTRPPAAHMVKEIYLMEIPSSTDWAIRSSFKPNIFIDIKKYIKLKIKAFKLYHTEYQKYPHSRSETNLKSQSVYRGSQVGLENIEAFEVYRIIN